MTGPLAGAAVVLPGQYSAAPGALEAWLDDGTARDVVAEASDVLGRDVVEWWSDPLNLCDPVVADLAAVVIGVAGSRSLRHSGLRPVVVAGHGVGEYAALVAAGALRLDQVVELVDLRAEMLVHSPRPSRAGMAAVVGPGAGEVARAVVADLGGATESLRIACVDGPAQVVLSGWRHELARVREGVVAAGLDMVRLPGRAACHGPLVQVIAERLAASLSELDWSVPDVPVVPNVDGRPSRDPDQLARCLRRHLTAQVQWEATSQALVEAGATWVVEVGTVPTLGPLIRQVHPDLPVHLAARPGLPAPTARPEHTLTGAAPTRGER